MDKDRHAHGRLARDARKAAEKGDLSQWGEAAKHELKEAMYREAGNASAARLDRLDNGHYTASQRIANQAEFHAHKKGSGISFIHD